MEEVDPVGCVADRVVDPESSWRLCAVQYYGADTAAETALSEKGESESGRRVE